MRSSSVVAVVVAAVLGAASGGVTATLLVRSGPPDAESGGAAAPPRADAGAEALALVRELGEENRDLRDRVAMLELRQQPAQRDPAGDFVLEQDFLAFSDEVRAWMAGTAGSGEDRPQVPIAPELKSQVAAALQDIRKEEQVAKVRKNLDREAADIDQRVAKVSEWLELDTYQEDQVRVILADKARRDRELVQMWEDGVDDEVLGEAKRTNARELLASFQRILTPGQYETFEARFGGAAKE
jgi:hypothetical protein